MLPTGRHKDPASLSGTARCPRKGSFEAHDSRSAKRSIVLTRHCASGRNEMSATDSTSRLADAGSNRRFDAFISYSRSVDSGTALALRSGLQRYAKPWFRRSAANVFLDDTNLAANPDLWLALREKISATSFFILFASPEAAQSKWVKKELVWWLSAGRCEEPTAFSKEQADRGRVSRTMLVLTDGVLEWNDQDGSFDPQKSTSLPAVASSVFEGEPAWVDLRWARDVPSVDLGRGNVAFMKAVAKLAAPVRGIDIVLLVDQDYAEHQRAVRHAWMAVALLAGLLALVLGLFARSRQLEVAEREQRVQTQANESRLLASLSRTEAARNNAVGAALLSLRGLPAANDPEPRRPVVEEVVRSLQDAIYAYGASRLVWTFDGHAGQRQALSEIDDVRSINKVSFSPDGMRVLTASPDATARVLDAATGSEVFALRHRFDVHDSSYSPDGRFIVTGSEDGLASLWSAADGRNIGNLNHWQDKDCGSGSTNIESSVGRVSVSPDSRHVLTLGRTGRHVWSVASPGLPACEGATLLDAYDPTGTFGLSIEERGFTIVTIADGMPHLHVERQATLVPGIAFAPNGRQVLAGFRDGHVELWNLETKSKKELRLPANDGIGLTAFDGTGAPVVFTDNGEEIAIWDVERSTTDWKIPLALLEPGAEATTIVAGPPVARTPLARGQILIALFNRRMPLAGARGLLIDRKTGGVLAQLLHPSGPIVRASFSPDGRRLVTGSKRGTVSLWDTSFADVGKVEHMGNSPSIAVRVSARDPAQVLIASRDGPLRAWNVDTGKDEWNVPTGLGPLEDAQLDAGGRYLALRDKTGRLRVVAVDPSRSFPVQAEGDDVGAMAFDGSGERLIVGQRDGSVWLWQLAPRLDKRKLYQTQAPTRYVGVSRGGAHGLSGHGEVTLRRDNNLYVSAVKDPARAVPLHGHSLPVLGGEIHEGAGRALSYGMDGVVFLWDLKRIDAALAASASSETIEPLARITAGQPTSTGGTFLPAHVQAVFSNDGARFVTVGHSAAIWNSADGRLVAHLRGHGGAINTAVFNADGTLVATAGTDTTVRVWRVESGAEVFVFRGHTRPVRALAFAGHAQSIVSASDDGTIRVWELQARPATLVRTALDILPRKQLTRAEQFLVGGAPLR